ncbi:MAG: ATPase [Cyanobacterium sp. T60_A2020_053]|nr:ATPase [Cyanobacterium sp. T60_A2020_053]
MASPLLTRFLISLNQNKFVGLLVFVLITGISVVIAVQPQPDPEDPVPKAIGRISLNNPLPTFTVTGEELQVQGRSVNLTDLLSPQVLEIVANRLQYSVGQIEEMITQKRLTIQLPTEEQRAQGGVGNLITLEYRGNRSPQETLSVLRVFMEELVNESYRINTVQLDNRIRNLEGRLGVVRQDLKEAEDVFYDYITGEGSLLLSIQNGSLFGGITSAQQQRRQLEVVLSGIEGEIATLENQLNLTADEAYTASALSADPIIASLRAQILQNELDLERFSKDLRPDHPTIVEIENQKAVNEKLMEERAQEVIGDDGILKPLTADIRKSSNLDPTRAQLASRLIALQSEREAIARQIESVTNIENTLQAEYEVFPERQTQQTQLIQEVQSQRILYQTVFSALIDARAAQAEADSSLTVVQPPFLAIEPRPVISRLNPLLIVAIGVGVGVMGAVAVIFLLATLDERLHTPEEIREVLTERGIPVLAELPTVQILTESRKKVPLLLDSNSVYNSYYERFRSNIGRFGAENTKIVLITSVSKREGKSISAYNLAIASANAGKRTLLVETDLRDKNPKSRKYFNIQPDPVFATDAIRYYDVQGGNLHDVIKRIDEVPNLFIMASPGYQAQAAAILESGEMKSFLRYARSQYDLVVLDTPSLSICNDALLLESFADGLILVTHPGISQRNLLETTIDEFVEAELPLIGTVINQVQFDLNSSQMDSDQDDDSSIFEVNGNGKVEEDSEDDSEFIFNG